MPGNQPLERRERPLPVSENIGDSTHEIDECARRTRKRMSTSGAAPAPILTEAELRLLQALVYQECGMHFDERRMHFLQDRLLRRLKECRADSFYSYYRLLISQEGKNELAKLVENLTVNETSFFRHKAQLDLFQQYVLEDMLKQKQARREYSIRIWSAGCSTGQEAYTLAMLVGRCAGVLLPAQPAARRDRRFPSR